MLRSSLTAFFFLYTSEGIVHTENNGEILSLQGREDVYIRSADGIKPNRMLVDICNLDEVVTCAGGRGVVVHHRTKVDCKEFCYKPSHIRELLSIYECGRCPTVSVGTTFDAVIAPSPTTVPVPVPAPFPVPVPVPVPAPAPAPAPAPVPVTAPTRPVTYNIQLNLINVTTDDRNTFKSVVSRWNNIIVDDMPNMTSAGIPVPFSGCKYPTVIDDLYICGKLETMDGVGGILGSAGPMYLRSSNGLTFIGAMHFDSDDITMLRSEGLLYSVILHEIGHILGIGTLWQYKGIQAPASMNCSYYGTNAIREYKTITGCNSLPIELEYGQGTRCGHFDEECLYTELMTGFSNMGMANPLSRITIGSLQDLGYPSVDYSKADLYNRSNVRSSCLCNRRLKGSGGLPISQEISSSARKVNQNGRKLSEEGRKAAVAYGVALLKSRIKKSIDAIENSLPSHVVDFGSEVVNVLYLEEGQIHDVHVTKADFI